MTAELVAASPPTVASIVATDRFARLRSDLAEAVASAELALLRAQADRWRTVAEERGHALERADFALQTLSRASSPSRSRPRSRPRPRLPAGRTGTGTGTRRGTRGRARDRTSGPRPPRGPSPIVPVPPHLRSEAVLYAESLVNRPTRTRWWRRKR